MILHKDRELFKDIIIATAEDLKLPFLYVEKDYWVSYILKSLSQSQYKDIAIFKGGTALSKAYKIIERFSEDIDLALITDDLGSNQIKKLIKRVEADILNDNFVEVKNHKLTSKGSEFRKTVYNYPKLEDGDFGHAVESITLEINSFATPYPFDYQEVSCYIADFLTQKAPNMIAQYELESFEINVLDIKRTFCEKISAIARASYESDSDLSSLKEKIRHLYDIYFLMQQREIVDFLNSREFAELMKIVRVDDSKQFQSEWTESKLSSTLIFTDTYNILKKIEHYYKTIFADLVYGKSLPKIGDIGVEIEKISNRLKEEKL